MNREHQRREFLEWIFAAASDRWILHRMFGVDLEPIDHVEILEQLVDLDLVEWRDVDPTSNDYGASRLPIMIRSRPADEARENRRARMRRATDRILAERREGSEGEGSEK